MPISIAGRRTGRSVGTAFDRPEIFICNALSGHHTGDVTPLMHGVSGGSGGPARLCQIQEGSRQVPAVEYSEVVYTGNNHDSKDLKGFHIDERTEKQIRNDFANGKLQRILIVTEKQHLKP
jgi:type I restriction enzyme, R subunit